MITDQQTNFLYLADSLPELYPSFYARFEEVLKQKEVKSFLPPGTKDIWARDFIPIQVQENSFVQFIYNPGYLKTKKEIASISVVDSICNEIKIAPTKSKIHLDGLVDRSEEHTSEL